VSKESVIQCRISMNYEQPRQSVVESQQIVTERAERLLVSPVHFLRGIHAYDELQK